MITRDGAFPVNRHPLYEAHRWSPAIRANGLLLTQWVKFRSATTASGPQA